MKRTIEIDDILDDTVEDTKTETIDLLEEIHKENPDFDKDQCVEAMQYDGRDSEIVDSNTPIYYSKIDGLYYLYANDFDEAYNNAGIGDGSEDNHRQVAIYCYLQEKQWDAINDWEIT